MFESPQTPARFDELTLNHIELYVTDLAAARTAFADQYGGHHLADHEPADGAHRSTALGIGRTVLVLTQGLSADHPASLFVRARGDGVADLALRTDRVRAAHASALAHGARDRGAPIEEDGAIRATIQVFGDVRHTFVTPPPGTEGHWVPGFGALPSSPGSTTGLTGADHFAVCLDAGSLDEVVRFYRTALGFDRTFSERIVVGSQAMDSHVVQNTARDVTLTLLEPDTTASPGQIDRFLKDNDGSGIQHVAFATEDIVRATAVLRERDVEFLSTPGAYYDRLTERITLERHGLAELRAAHVLADEDHGGQLFQIFTRSTHPHNTLFYEVVERCGATTFGSGNIKALYEAVETGQSADRPR
ncbi:4-hydroxyphenylpyruvate dioxygenase [Streptomyces rubiginosohelvolus]|uniref:4-hydroxyphenylpyruvate dioxygenase n=1 Tax=Streptomyces rubiginosohelvolus TaxID=67362 RepID=UPI0033A03453